MYETPLRRSSVQADGTELIEQAALPAIYSSEGNYDFTTSPDNRYVAFAHQEGECQQEHCTRHLFAANASGQQVRQLTHGTAQSDGSDLFNDTPTWSPDSTRLVFISNRGSTNELYSINVDGSGEWRPTSDIDLFSALEWLVVPHVPPVTPTLTPQAAVATPPPGSIVVAVERPEELDYDLYRFATPGGEPTRITRHGSANYAPTLSPDGTQIAYISNRNGDTVLVLTDRNGSTFKALDQGLPAVDPILSVACSPDDTRLDYQKECGLYTVQADGSDIRPLLEEPTDQRACFRDPAWSPDGTQIVFSIVRGGQLYQSAIARVDASGGTPILLTEYVETAWPPISEQHPVFCPVVIPSRLSRDAKAHRVCM